MDFPSSELTSEQLEQWFQESGYVERLFYPRQVPERPSFFKTEGELTSISFQPEKSNE